MTFFVIWLVQILILSLLSWNICQSNLCILSWNIFPESKIFRWEKDWNVFGFLINISPPNIYSNISSCILQWLQISFYKVEMKTNKYFTIGFPMKVIFTVDTGLLFFRGFIWPKMFVPPWSAPASLSRLCLLLPVLLRMLFLRLSAGPSIVLWFVVFLGPVLSDWPGGEHSRQSQ